jgi:hypothetical protein
VPTDRSIRTLPRGPLVPEPLAVVEGGGDPWWGFNGYGYIESLGTSGSQVTETIYAPDSSIGYLLYPADGILPAGAFLIRGSIDCTFASAPTTGFVRCPPYHLPDAEAGGEDVAVGGIIRGLGYPRAARFIMHFTGAILSDVPWTPELTVINSTNRVLNTGEIRYEAFGSTPYAHNTTIYNPE